MSVLLCAGIDVAKAELVLACCDAQEQFLPERRYPNNKAGIARLKRYLLKLGVVRVCLEPTSRYHLAALFALCAEAALQVSVVNPYAARSFARATLVRGKTDHVDAQVLARYVLHCAPVLYAPPRKAALELRAITRRVARLVVDAAAQKNILHAALAGGDPRCVIRSIQLQLAQLERWSVKLEDAALAVVQADAVLAACYELLLSIKGVGQRSALALLGELAVLPPDMGKAQWVALAGLDPTPQESGQRQDTARHISRQGNVHLRRALFMPAFVAAYRPGPAQAYYAGLLARGKEKMQALVALMRKLLCAIWGMFASQTPFDPQRFYHQTT